VPLPGIRWDSGADERYRLDFSRAKQRHVANPRRALTLGPHGLKVRAIEQQEPPKASRVGEPRGVGSSIPDPKDSPVAATQIKSG
jgi:hypothetical protein